MIYFIGDNHWGHKSIIYNAQRPFQNVFEMDEYMIEAWNSVITNDDEVYHLGDMSYKTNPKRFGEILERLNGRIYLIRGNHDKEKLINRFKDRFEWVKNDYRFQYEYLETTYDFVLFHYPIYSWNRIWYGSIHIHGHTHTNEPFFNKYHPGRVINVSVENLDDYKPISIIEVIEKMSKKIVTFTKETPKNINDILKSIHLLNNDELKEFKKLLNL